MNKHKRYILKKITPNKPRVVRLIKKLFLDEDSFFYTTGFFSSFIKKTPCEIKNCKSLPLPWYNLSFIKFIKSRINKDMTIFEFGSGYSTLFFSKLVKQVVAIEHDKKWYKKIQNSIKKRGIKNIKLIFNPLNDEYTNYINKTTKKYNIIIVDGRKRVDSIYNSLDNLTKDGVIILDDSQRKSYKKGIEFLQKKGFRKIDIWGLKLTTILFLPTSIFYKNNNCLGI